MVRISPPDRAPIAPRRKRLGSTPSDAIMIAQQLVHRAMPYTATVEDRIVHIAWEGTVSQQDLDAVDQEIPRLAAELRFAPHVLHTFAPAMTRAFEPMDVFALAQRRSTRKIPVPVKSALVVRGAEARRVAEVFLALNRSPNLTMETFTSEKAARAWLAE